jgi:hypothetical protein
MVFSPFNKSFLLVSVEKDVRRTFLLLLYQIKEHCLCFVSFYLCYEPHSVCCHMFLV